MSCSVPGGSPPGGGGGPNRGIGAAPMACCRFPQLNMIINGTGVFAAVGVTTISGMSTVMSGYAELST